MYNISMGWYSTEYKSYESILRILPAVGPGLSTISSLPVHLDCDQFLLPKSTGTRGYSTNIT